MRWEEVNPGEGFQALKPELDVAALYGHGGIVDLILRRGITMDAMTVWTAFKCEQSSPIPGRSIPVFQAFIDAWDWGINDDINCTGTPLQHAVSGGYMELAQWMLDHGANPNNCMRNLKRTTLATACENSSLAMIKLLLKNGASIGDSGGMHAAARRGRVDVLALLLFCGADIDEVPENPWIRQNEPRISTPLHAAVEANERSTVSFLIARGADISVENLEGRTILEVAKAKSYWGLTDLLRQGSTLKDEQ